MLFKGVVRKDSSLFVLTNVLAVGYNVFIQIIDLQIKVKP